MLNPQPPRLIDYHMHTGVTVDAKMTETQACERAVSMGIHEIAFTNHIMLNHSKYHISPEACLVHWERIRACQEQYPGLGIRLGIEMDYYPGREEEIAATLRSYEELLGRPLDIVLGSIHELNGIFFSHPDDAPALFRDRELASVYCEYFAVAAQAVRSRLYDVMAHPDLIKKYTHVLTSPLPFAEYQSAVEPYIDALLEDEVGLELNTKGLKINVKEAYPSTQLLELYLLKARISGREPIITLGSDAHTVEEVGGCLQEGAAILRGLGVTALARFGAHVRSAWDL
ncbi:MAG: histidinol-phosphatase HisJ family protein [Bacteroidota bacterium]